MDSNDNIDLNYSQGFKLEMGVDQKSIGNFQKLIDGFGLKLEQGIASLRDTIVNGLQDVFRESLTELSNILESSQLSNRETRDLAFQYGFTASEAYGFKNALEAVGLESEEDLWYATEQELREFSDAFQTYSEKYSSLYDTGFFEDLQEFQYQWKMFKDELVLEVVQFFVNNKDLIVTGLHALESILTGVLKIVNWMLPPDQSKSVSVSDMMASRGYVKTNNTSISIDNTFNGVQSTDRSTLINAGQQTYMPIIAAIRGGEI